MDRNEQNYNRYEKYQEVALRKESVDRNEQNYNRYEKYQEVALRKESVDRNVFGFGAKLVHSCRSP